MRLFVQVHFCTLQFFALVEYDAEPADNGFARTLHHALRNPIVAVYGLRSRDGDCPLSVPVLDAAVFSGAWVEPVSRADVDVCDFPEQLQSNATTSSARAALFNTISLKINRYQLTRFVA